jgi:hypothetical protein
MSEGEMCWLTQTLKVNKFDPSVLVFFCFFLKSDLKKDQKPWCIILILFC